MSTSVPFNESEAKRAVVKVGEGRGFVVESAHNRLVITAAHCLLPRLPVPDPGAKDERTYERLLGPLGHQEPVVTSECCFVDLVSDLAVLGPPDNQSRSKEADAYHKLVESSAALPIASVPAEAGVEFAGWLLSLPGAWCACTISQEGGGLYISKSNAAIIGGMSGSPILNGDGAAIGVISCSSGTDDEVHTAGGPNPRLLYHLPIWLVDEMSSE
jgi:trypsin-like peptidase